MPEYNLIQRPELIDRMRRFLGLRQKSTTPTLATTLQPVLVVGDLDRPIRLGGMASGGRKPLYQSAQTNSVAGTNAGQGIVVASGLPHTKIYLRRVILTARAGVGMTVSDYWHPAGVNQAGVQTDWGTGGDSGQYQQSFRSGLANTVDVGGFVPGPLVSLVLPTAPTYLVLDLEGFVLTSQNIMGNLPGGGGQGYWLAHDSAVVGSGFQAIWFWEEESAPAVGSA